MRLTGLVEAGQGDARKWLERFGAAYARKTGMPIFPGSLNLRLPQPLDWNSPALRTLTIAMPREEYGGERDILLLPCRLTSLDGLPAYLWSTSRVLLDPEPPAVIEVITSVGLRAVYSLEDGDAVVLELITGARPSTG